MAGYLADALDWINDTLDEQTGVSVVYSRGPVSATVTAVPGNTVFESDSEFGVLRIQSRDFLITKSRLNDAGFGEPQRGDRIVETVGDDEHEYEALDISGSPVFAYSDQSRKRVRVYTKRIKTQ